MIKAVLVFNLYGQPRFTKFYQYYPESKQQEILQRIFKIITAREDYMCNFVEGCSFIGGPHDKLIYRHYATLYFVVCADSSENELGILDLMHVFVEVLDKCFGNVCELDIVFHTDKVHYILDEIILGGLILDPNISEIVKLYKKLYENEKREVPVFYHETH